MNDKKTILGFDYLGAVCFEREMLKTHPKGRCGGLFLRTFKRKDQKVPDARMTVEHMAISGDFSELTVQMAPFDGDHNYPKKLTDQLKEDAIWLNGVPMRYPVPTLISPFCEHKHPRSVMEPIFEELKILAPHCLLVNSILPGMKAYNIPGVILELHLQNSKKLPPEPEGEYQISMDGWGGDGSGDFTDCDLEAIIKMYPRARQFRGWNFRCNGKFGHSDTAAVFNRKNWPSEKDLNGYHAQFKHREIPMAYPNNSLYKPFADDHGKGGKDNKAMVITPKAQGTLQVKDKNGKTIAQMTRMYPDHADEPKGPRYYSTKYAYELGDLAEKSSGSRIIKIANLPLTDADLRSNRLK